MVDIIKYHIVRMCFSVQVVEYILDVSIMFKLYDTSELIHTPY